MPATYEPIATTTLGSAASTISFTSIGSGYTDLRVILVAILETQIDGSPLLIRLNSDSGNNYSNYGIRGTGTAASGFGAASQNAVLPFGIIGNGTIPSMFTIDIFSYAGAMNKTILFTSDGDQNGSGSLSRGTGMWSNTNAVTSISLTPNSGINFKSGTTATLYGILKA